jgi:hypothetical protein
MSKFRTVAMFVIANILNNVSHVRLWSITRHSFISYRHHTETRYKFDAIFILFLFEHLPLLYIYPHRTKFQELTLTSALITPVAFGDMTFTKFHEVINRTDTLTWWSATIEICRASWKLCVVFKLSDQNTAELKSSSECWLVSQVLWRVFTAELTSRLPLSLVDWSTLELFNNPF